MENRLSYALKCCQVTSSNIENILRKIDRVVLVLDGFDCKSRIENALYVINLLKDHNKRVTYLTNDEMMSREEWMRRLYYGGIKDLKINDMISMGHATALYMVKKLKMTNRNKIFLCAGDSMVEEMQNHLFTVFVYDKVPLDPDDLHNFLMENNIDSIVIGGDINFSYKKCLGLAKFLRAKPRTKIIITNLQPNSVIRSNLILPGVGPIVHMLREIVDLKNYYIVGKPEEPFFRLLMGSEFLVPDRTLIIGENMYSDIMFAQRGNFVSMLCTGKREYLKRAIKKEFSDNLIDRLQCPNYYVKGLGAFAAILKKLQRNQISSLKLKTHVDTAEKTDTSILKMHKSSENQQSKFDDEENTKKSEITRTVTEEEKHKTSRKKTVEIIT